MKGWLLLLLACATLACGAEKPNDARLADALAEAEKLAAAENWKDALAAGQRLRNLSREQRGEEHPDTALADLFLGEVRDHLGDRTLAEAHFRRALAIQEKTLAPNAPELVTTLTRLGACLKDTKRHDEAAGLLRRALDLELEIHGPDHLATATARRNLARVLRAKGDWARAAALLEKALTTERRALGGAGPETLAGLQELAQLHERAGNFAAAEQAVAERVAGAEATFGAQSPELAAALSDWGRFAERQSHFSDAEPRYRRALSIHEAHHSDEPALAGALTQLGWCLRQLDRYDEAQPLLARALELRRHVPGAEHADTAWSCRNLGWIFRLKHDFAAARPLFEEALAIREHALGPKDALTLESLGELGDLHWLAGEFDAAAALMEKRRYRAEEAFGPDSAETAAAWHSLAIVYEAAKRWSEATQAALRSLRLHEQRLGPADAKTLGEMVLLSRICGAAGALDPALTQYARLAAWFRQHPEAPADSRTALLRQFAIATLRAGKSDEAGPLFRESRRAHETGLGPDDPATLRSIGDLWTYYDETHQPALAREAAEELARRTEAALGADTPATAEVFDRLGQLDLTLGDRTAALKSFRRALDSRRRHFGDGSPEWLDSLAQVAAWFDGARDFTSAVALRTERLGAISRKLGPESAAATTATGDLAMSYFRQGDLRAARGMFNQQFAQVAKRAGPESAEALTAVARLGDVEIAARDWTAAVRERERLATGCAHCFGNEHLEHGRALLLLGEALLAQGAPAEQPLTDAERIIRTHRATGLASRVACGLARAALRRGDRETAKRQTRDALSGTFPHDEPLAEAFSLLGEELARAGEAPASESALTGALLILTQSVGDHDEHTLALLEHLGKLRVQLDQPGAVALFERALSASETLRGAESPKTAEMLGWLALAQAQGGQLRPARDSARRMLSITRNSGGIRDPYCLVAAEIDASLSLRLADPPAREAALFTLAEMLETQWGWTGPIASQVTASCALACSLATPRQ